MVKERLFFVKRLLKRLPTNASDEVRLIVGRKVHQVFLSDEVKMGILDTCEEVENIIEKIPILGIVYQYKMGIKNILNVRRNDRLRLRPRLGDVLYSEGDPKLVHRNEAYRNR